MWGIFLPALFSKGIYQHICDQYFPETKLKNNDILIKVTFFQVASHDTLVRTQAWI